MQKDFKDNGYSILNEKVYWTKFRKLFKVLKQLVSFIEFGKPDCSNNCWIKLEKIVLKFKNGIRKFMLKGEQKSAESML